MRHRAAVFSEGRLSTIIIGLLFTNAAVGFGLYFRERSQLSASEDAFFQKLEAAQGKRSGGGRSSDQGDPRAHPIRAPLATFPALTQPLTRHAGLQAAPRTRSSGRVALGGLA